LPRVNGLQAQAAILFTTVPACGAAHLKELTMKRRLSALLLGLACFTALLPTPSAQPRPARVDQGQREFLANCASCHGSDAKGRGPIVEWLTKSPPDLTALAAGNGGVFPISRVYDAIDGASVAIHGTRDMPVWGQVYRIEAGEYWGELPYDPQQVVRGRILGLIDYLYRIQRR
jgi:mono/diheme cytochrome c family protein